MSHLQGSNLRPHILFRTSGLAVKHIRHSNKAYIPISTASK